MRALLPLGALAVFSFGIGFPQGPQPLRSTALERIRPYRSWYCTTPQAVDMAPGLILSCVGPAKWDMDPVNPHVPRLYKVYVNPIAKAAMLSTKPQPFPVGAIVVKEKFAVTPPRAREDLTPRKLAPDAKPEMLTVMIKREKGFSPANGDWEYLVVSGDLQRLASHGLDHCSKCHATAKERDFVWTRSLREPFPKRW